MHIAFGFAGSRGSRLRMLRALSLPVPFMLATILLSAMAAGAATSSVSPADDAEDVSYWYHGAPRPLAVDETRIAVFVEETPEDLAGQVAAAGQAELTDQEDRGSWQLFSVPNASATAVLAEAAPLLPDYFFSPVLRDPASGQDLLFGDMVAVQFEPDVPLQVVLWILEEHGAGEIIEYEHGGRPNTFVTKPSTNHALDVMSIANALAAEPEVRWATPDLVSLSAPSQACSPLSPRPPTDPNFASSWGLEQANDIDLDAMGAWATCAGKPSTIVAVLDVGVQENHPDLSTIQGRDFWAVGCGNPTGCAGGNPQTSCDNHGTSVAGPVGEVANNGIGSAGVAPNVKVVGVRVRQGTNTFPTCGWTGSTLREVWGIDWAVHTAGARVTVYSWGALLSDNLENMYASTRDEGVVHFAAAGNDNSDANDVDYPGRLRTVLSIGAIAQNGTRWVDDFETGSNYGPELDLVAPGKDIFVTDRTGSAGQTTSDYWTFSGTSFATPMAAGIAALILSMRPELDAYDVEWLLSASAIDLGPAGRDNEYGRGLVNAAQAVLLTPPYIFADSFEKGDTSRWSVTVP